MDEMPNQPTSIAEFRVPAPNKITLSAPPAYKVSNQSISTIQLKVSASDKPTSSMISANEALNQLLSTVQLGIPALLQHDLARVPGILPAPVPPKDLIIQNTI